MTETLDRILEDAPKPSNISDFGDIGYKLVGIVIGAALMASTIGIIMAGIKYITSKGDRKAVENAKHALTYSIIGFLIAAGAGTIRIVVLNFVSN